MDSLAIYSEVASQELLRLGEYREDSWAFQLRKDKNSRSVSQSPQEGTFLVFIPPSLYILGCLISETGGENQ